jgi:DivIVA domain-containing protein
MIQRPRFHVVRRGYEPDQVDQYLTRLDQEMNRLTANLRQEREIAHTGSQQLLTERDDALMRLAAVQAELNSLRGSRDATAGPVPAQNTISLFGERLQTILTTAEQEASAVKTEAQEQAGRIVTEAEQRAAALATEARQQADALLAQARQEAVTALDTARREEREIRSVLADLMQRREQVLRHLTEIGSAIGSLLGEDTAALSSTASSAAPQVDEPTEVVAPSEVGAPQPRQQS